MQIIEHENKIIVRQIKNFDLSQTLDCGQCFRWLKTDDKYCGIASGKYLEVKQIDNSLILENTTTGEFENFWKDYFDLNTNYSHISSELTKMHPIVQKAHEYCGGIRILNQEPWETLCSFIISQNNNIPRIKKIISSLCSLFGDNINGNFSFPTAQKLATLQPKDLAPIKSGFRAKYILDAAWKVANNEINLAKIKTMNFEQAKNTLMKINGVGPKIADCTLLYGFHRLDAFPMDVWMKRIMATHFPQYTSQHFGKYAGVAQQWLYHFFRNHS